MPPVFISFFLCISASLCGHFVLTFLKAFANAPPFFSWARYNVVGLLEQDGIRGVTKEPKSALRSRTKIKERLRIGPAPFFSDSHAKARPHTRNRENRNSLLDFFTLPVNNKEL